MQRVFHGIRFKVNKGCLSAMDGQFFYIYTPAKSSVQNIYAIFAQYRLDTGTGRAPSSGKTEPIPQWEEKLTERMLI